MKYLLSIILLSTIIAFLPSCSTTKQTLKPSLKDEMNISIVDGFGNDSVYLIR